MKVSVKKFVTENLEDFKYQSNKVIIVSKEVDIINPVHINNDVGVDLYNIKDEKFLYNDTKIVPTGVKVACPTGLHFEIRPRSSMPLKTPLRLANSPGTIDPDYRGEIGLILWYIDNNPEKQPYVLPKITKICQLCLIPYIPMNSDNYCEPFNSCIEVNYYYSKIIFEKFEELTPTSRGSGGFGSTGGY